MKKAPVFHSRTASSLVAVMLFVAVLTAIAGTAILEVANRRITLGQTARWQESLIAAESGAHDGIAYLEGRLAVSQNNLPTTNYAVTSYLPNSRSSYSYTLRRSAITVNGVVKPYYSIVSTGTALLQGARSVSLDPRDIVLRKLNIRTAPRLVTRTVEVWLRPYYNTDGALKVDGTINMNNKNIFVDSYNSSDPTRSNAPIVTGGVRQPGTTAGQFNAAPYNVLGANVSTNGSSFNAGNATIWGDALTNGGIVGNTANIKGEIRDDYYEPIAPVSTPSWFGSGSGYTTGVDIPKYNGQGKLTGTSTVTALKTGTTIRGGTAASPARYVLDSIALSGSSDIVTFDFGQTGTTNDPTKSYVELYVKGDVATKGQGASSDGSFVVVNGINVTIYVGGNMTFGGNGISNASGNPANLTLYGINPTAPTTQSFTLAGAAQFYGVVYAPGADLKLAGGGSNGKYVGSMVGKTAFLNGNTQITYDESLSGKGLITRFGIASWFEDAKKSGAFTGQF